MEEEDLSLNWTVFRHFPRVWSGRDDEEKASKSHQESFCSLGTNIKQTLNEVKHGLKRVWECIPPCALCPSLAWTAKLFLTASKHVWTSCSHDTLKLFAFSVNSWLTLCQLEIVLPRKLSMTQKQNSLSPLSKSRICTACPLMTHRTAGALLLICYWGLLGLPQESLRPSAFSHLCGLVLGQSMAVSNPKYFLCACRS